MSLTSGFFDSIVTSGTPDRLYTAEDMNNILDGVVSDGICEWGNDFDFDLDSSNPNKPYIKSGRGKIAKHWFTNDGTALAALTNSTNNTKYYAICISCDLSSRTVSFVYKPSSTGSTSIPDIHANDTDTLKTCGLWMITLPPHTSLSDAESSWSSLIGTAPSGDPHPENYTPYIQFLGDAPSPDLSNYVQKTGSSISGAFQFNGPDAKIVFNGIQSSSNGISGFVNPLGEGKLTVTGVKSPTEPTDAVPLKFIKPYYDITFTGGPNNWSCDKTYSETLDAYRAGKIIRANLIDPTVGAPIVTELTTYVGNRYLVGMAITLPTNYALEPAILVLVFGNEGSGARIYVNTYNLY